MGVEALVATSLILAAASTAYNVYQQENMESPEFTLPEPPPHATEVEKENYKKAKTSFLEQRRRSAAAQGRGSTILTGAKLGDMGDDYGSKPKTALGA